ncbi:DUF433 domain-containing protein [Pirellulimonas nuda]|nr:DUF433 domain-containing protein [Pirellulimonas nuda]
MDYDINQFLEMRPKRDGRMRPFIKGTRVEALSIISDSETHNMTPEEIAEGYPHVSLAAIYAALAYYHGARDEVRRMIREDDASLKQQVGAAQG